MKYFLSVILVLCLSGCATVGTCEAVLDTVPLTTNYALSLIDRHVPPEKLEEAVKMPPEEFYAKVRLFTGLVTEIGKKYCPKPPPVPVDPPPAE
jgi:hypothetical protein